MDKGIKGSNGVSTSGGEQRNGKPWGPNEWDVEDYIKECVTVEPVLVDLIEDKTELKKNPNSR